MTNTLSKYVSLPSLSCVFHPSPVLSMSNECQPWTYIPVMPTLDLLSYLFCQIRGLSHGDCRAHETWLRIFVLCTMSGLQIPKARCAYSRRTLPVGIRPTNVSNIHTQNFCVDVIYWSTMSSTPSIAYYGYATHCIPAVCPIPTFAAPVSYTHLTLPTIYSV